jgi:hypothetical protein
MHHYVGAAGQRAITLVDATNHGASLDDFFVPSLNLSVKLDHGNVVRFGAAKTARRRCYASAGRLADA